MKIPTQVGNVQRSPCVSAVGERGWLYPSDKASNHVKCVEPRHKGPFDDQDDNLNPPGHQGSTRCCVSNDTQTCVLTQFQNPNGDVYYDCLCPDNSLQSGPVIRK
jgi:hypothetical protein